MSHNRREYEILANGLDQTASHLRDFILHPKNKEKFIELISRLITEYRADLDSTLWWLSSRVYSSHVNECHRQLMQFLDKLSQATELSKAEKIPECAFYLQLFLELINNEKVNFLPHDEVSRVKNFNHFVFTQFIHDVWPENKLLTPKMTELLITTFFQKASVTLIDIHNQFTGVPPKTALPTVGKLKHSFGKAIKTLENLHRGQSEMTQQKAAQQARKQEELTKMASLIDKNAFNLAKTNVGKLFTAKYDNLPKKGKVALEKFGKMPVIIIQDFDAVEPSADVKEKQQEHHALCHSGSDNRATSDDEKDHIPLMVR